MINHLQSPLFESEKQSGKKDIVNNAIRICIKCGNTIVKKNNLGLYCKGCDSFFKWKEISAGGENNGA